MIPASFEYFRPKAMGEAFALLEQHGEEAKILSGGQSLIPMMKLRLARPAYIIDINEIPGLRYVKEEDGYLKIGGLTHEADLEASDLIHSKYPIILDTASLIADPQVRNMATVGGNLAHGDPANDHPATCWPSTPRWWLPDPTGRGSYQSRISFSLCSPRRSSMVRSSRRSAFRFLRPEAGEPISSWRGRWAISPQLA